MNELIKLLWEFLQSDDAPELYDDEGQPIDEQRALEVAQQIAEHIVASGWPKA